MLSVRTLTTVAVWAAAGICSTERFLCATPMLEARLAPVLSDQKAIVGEGDRNGDDRPLRLPQNRAERRSWHHPPESHTGDPDKGGRNRDLADGAVERARAYSARCRGVRSRSWREALKRTRKRSVQALAHSVLSSP